ncbi:hypothetical protein MIDIC_510042 [Alphaproteobacteria bacterium]
MEIDFTEIYCHVDDFCKGFIIWLEIHLLSSRTNKRNRRRSAI